MLLEQKSSAVVGIVVASIGLGCAFLLPPITLRRMDRLDAAISRRQLQSDADRPSKSE
jgi:hypothetical protein